ncbi:gamma-glutamyltransferase [Priestia sp. 179-F W1.4 NHS]|uniref:gamma-glutamyltransferase n=1 Tax=Priestia sp. 179-F W1.4 NHS TaxID=3374296 RepID=UPI003878FC5C
MKKKEFGKRSRTSIAPTILKKGDEVIEVGTRGGSRLLMMLMEVLVRHFLFKDALQDVLMCQDFQ